MNKAAANICKPVEMPTAVPAKAGIVVTTAVSEYGMARPMVRETNPAGTKNEIIDSEALVLKRIRKLVTLTRVPVEQAKKIMLAAPNLWLTRSARYKPANRQKMTPVSPTA